jgi:hypothetical protein
MPERASGLTERRDRKNEVDMMSKGQPTFRAMASARGMFGVSMKPKCRFNQATDQERHPPAVENFQHIGI